MLTLDYYLWREATSFDRGGAAVAAILGEEAGLAAITDHLIETGEAQMTPFEVDDEVLIQSVTLYYVGRVKEIRGAFFRLEHASWVHWTGRITSLCKGRDFKTGFRSGERKPRTEYIGSVWLNLAAVVTSIPGPWKLPLEPIAS